MKKGQEYTGTVTEVEFPNKGQVHVETENGEEICTVKDTYTGQTVRFRVHKKRGGRTEGILSEVLKRAASEIDPPCPHFGSCGGCTWLNLPYEEQLALKESQVRALLAEAGVPDQVFEGIKGSPVTQGYRNKMEFSFGDALKDGPLELGLHKKGSFYDVISVPHCRIVDNDYRQILTETLSYFRGKETPYFHKRTHQGFLRHLLIRKAAKTGELLVDLVTTSQFPPETICTEISLLEDWKNLLLERKLQGRIVGILHTVNDSPADAVKDEHTTVLYGQDYFEEELSGLRFKITPFSFFQTNTLSAEVVYDTAAEYAQEALSAVNATGETPFDPVLFDLYSGTGTIAQLMARQLADLSPRVIGVEIVPEAVQAARENAAANGLDNCSFIAGDVLQVLDEIVQKPDLVILDPPRDGLHPKAIEKLMRYELPYIVYISCKPTSLARDLAAFAAHGYQVKRACAIDQFPGAGHVESCVLLQRVSNTRPKAITLDVEMEDYYRIKGNRTND
ncbi:MAG: 23S rRNA (uracil(1939)-C(5))-methyltransferase RlmD [Lachnospiraceae bacterium]|nr:23S rRNA (uracil(1939)-C(5))-methyltransferase RlmD [Lachnospiraceae bacterium]